ncbi:MAG TPA: hypothetical protein VL943_01625, partial [Niabella sp.]|nr:hypothetical protein [Niabella sp.]
LSANTCTTFILNVPQFLKVLKKNILQVMGADGQIILQNNQINFTGIINFALLNCCPGLHAKYNMQILFSHKIGAL